MAPSAYLLVLILLMAPFCLPVATDPIYGASSLLLTFLYCLYLWRVITSAYLPLLSLFMARHHFCLPLSTYGDSSLLLTCIYLWRLITSAYLYLLMATRHFCLPVSTYGDSSLLLTCLYLWRVITSAYLYLLMASRHFCLPVSTYGASSLLLYPPLLWAPHSFCLPASTYGTSPILPTRLHLWRVIRSPVYTYGASSVHLSILMVRHPFCVPASIVCASVYISTYDVFQYPLYLTTSCHFGCFSGHA